MILKEDVLRLMAIFLVCGSGNTEDLGFFETSSHPGKVKESLQLDT